MKKKWNRWLRSMKVALISHEGGGISSVTSGLAHSLSKRGVPTTIFSATSKKAHVRKLEECLDVVYLPYFDFPPRPVWFQLRNFRVLSKLLNDYTVVHGVSTDMSTFYSVGKRVKPFIVSIHGVPLSRAKAFANSPISSWTCGDFGYHILELPLRDFLVRTCLENSNHIVTCSHTVFNELGATYRHLPVDKVSVIYNGINFDEILNGKIGDKNATNQTRFSIVYAGRLFWMKGVIFALRAFEIARTNFKDLHLYIFGKGPMERMVRKFIHDTSLGGYVHLQGHVSHKSLIAEVKKSDVVVLPSLYEAQPVFALEAMACKKPVVVFNLPFARELIVDGRNGLLAETGDVSDLSDKIQSLLSDKEHRFKLGENAYNYVKREHNWDILVERYLEIYRNLAEKCN